MRRIAAILVSMVALIAAGCDEEATPLGPQGRLGPEPNTCTGTWLSVHVIPQHPAGSVKDIGWLNDRVYYRRYDFDAGVQMKVETITRAGTITAVSAPDHYVFTNDGQNLISIGGKVPDSAQELWAKPIEGSAWTLETSFAFALAGVGLNLAAHPFVITKEAIYGGVSTKEAYLISRFDRTTGVEQRLAAVRFPSFASQDNTTTFFVGKLALWNDWLFFYSDSATFSVPKAGGEPIFMTNAYGSGSGPLAVSSSGQALFQGFDSADTSFLATAQVGTGGPPTRVQGNLPKQMLTTAAFDDGRGGWILAGVERLADGVDHLTVHSLDAAGKSRRLACDPEVGRSAFDGAMSPEGVYLAPFQVSPVHNEIVFVPREPASP